MEKVSVIVPIYNVAPYLAECIESITNQTYANLEILLVNDGATDDSLQICEHYRQKDPRIKVISHQNSGRGPARNWGLKFATGSLILFVDGDDAIGYDHIRNLYQILKKEHSDAVFSYYHRVDDNGAYYFCVADKEKGQYHTYSSRELLNSPYWTRMAQVWARLYKKRLFHNIEFPNGTYEDAGTSWKIITNAHSISCVKNEDYRWRLRQGQVTRSNLKVQFHNQVVDFHYREEELALLTVAGIPTKATKDEWVECVLGAGNWQKSSQDQQQIQDTNYRLQLFHKYC